MTSQHAPRRALKRQLICQVFRHNYSFPLTHWTSSAITDKSPLQKKKEKIWSRSLPKLTRTKKFTASFRKLTTLQCILHSHGSYHQIFINFLLFCLSFSRGIFLQKWSACKKEIISFAAGVLSKRWSSNLGVGLYAKFSLVQLFHFIILSFRVI